MATSFLNKTDLKEIGTVGTALHGRSEREFSLQDENQIWYVANGKVDLFLVHASADQVIHPYEHVLRAQKNQLIFGCQKVEVNGGGYIELRAKPSNNAELHTVTYDSVESLVDRETLIKQVDNWIKAFSDFVVKEIEETPRPTFRLSTGAFTLEGGCTVAARSGVVWFKSDEKSSYLGLIDGKDDAMHYLPLTNQSWIVCATPTATYEVLDTSSVLEEMGLKTLIGSFHSRVTQAEELNRVLATADEANLQLDRVKLRHQTEQEARRALTQLIRGSSSDTADDALLCALEIIGSFESIDFDLVNHKHDKELPLTALVPQIAARSGVTTRLVHLNSDEDWWRGNNGALLAFRSIDNAPVAILPNRFGSNAIHDPATTKSRRITKRVANELHDFAYMFIAPLPSKPVTFRELLFFLFRNRTLDLARLVISGIALGLVSLMPAIAIGFLVDWIFVSQSISLIGLTITILFCSSILGLLLQLYQNSTLLQVEGLSTVRLTAGFFDRILRLPRTLLSEVTSGDLAERAMSFHYFRDSLSGAVMQSLASALFFLPSVFLLFAFDQVLAGVTMIVGVFSFTSIVAIGLAQGRWQKQYLRIHQNLAGKMMQYINGISKLRTSGAESAVFAQWAQDYREKKGAELEIKKLQAVSMATAMTIPSFGAAMLFVFTFLQDPQAIQTGNFLVIYIAAMVFLTAVAHFGNSLTVLASIAPSFQRIKPILAQEVGESATMIPWISENPFAGEVRLDHVSFAYRPEDDPVINDISLHMEPGEFVALVGASGCGKTTLLRLILGLEKPSAGAVLYDEHNIHHGNLRMLRRNVGVVVQGGELFPGTILDNIIGNMGDASEEDAWLAAEKAAVAKEIEAMDMGMRTQVNEDETFFSGGQVQRILIAAAIVHNPSILILDEATNWLDNESQAEVMRNVSQMACTRLVVAHRLSTIKSADKIYVMSDGQVVEQGTYDQLMSVDGAFRRLAAKQLSRDDL